MKCLHGLIALLLLLTAPLHCADNFALKGDETIVFYGDSITQSGQYINYFESYLLTRFPETTFRIINHGISSETISGTTEEDHDPPRPWALPRFTRDVADWEPDVVVACFGMNDGNYCPFEPVRFGKYQEGVRTLIERTKEETEARLVLMTPPPFDPYRRKASDENAVTYGYKFAAIDYDHTLAKYSEWLVSLRDEGQTVVDLHTPMNEHLRQRRKKQVSFFLAGDAVHPSSTGHWLMAQHLLTTLNAPALADRAEIDAATGKVQAGDVSDVQRTEQGLTFQWTSRLPMPMDPTWDAESIRLERVSEALNQYRLRVTGLQPGKYAVTFGDDATESAIVTADQLAEGLDLVQFPQLPTNKAAQRILSLVRERRDLHYRDWRASIAGKTADADPAQAAATIQRIGDITQEIESLRQPQALRVRIERQP